MFLHIRSNQPFTSQTSYIFTFFNIYTSTVSNEIYKTNRDVSTSHRGRMSLQRAYGKIDNFLVEPPGFEPGTNRL